MKRILLASFLFAPSAHAVDIALPQSAVPGAVNSVAGAAATAGVTQQLSAISSSLTGPSLLPTLQSLRTQLLYLPEGPRKEAVGLALQAVSGSPETVGRLAARQEPAQAREIAALAIRAWAAAKQDPAVARQLKFIRHESWAPRELRDAGAERRSAHFREQGFALKELRHALTNWGRRDADLEPVVGRWLNAYGANGSNASLAKIPAPTLRQRITAYFFDIDDNLFIDLPTRIVIFSKADGSEHTLSTEEFALLSEKIGRADEMVTANGKTFNASHYEFRQDANGSFREFKDADGKNNFFPALKEAVDTLPPEKWQGPAWKAFVRALSDPETAQQVAIITARGHLPQSYIEAFRYLQEKGFINYVPRVENMHGVDGAPDRVKAKMEVMAKLLDQVQKAPFGPKANKIIDQDGTGLKVLHSAGFSDDDWNNLNGTASGLKAAIQQDPERWSTVKVFLYFTGTKHPVHKPGVYVLKSNGEPRPVLAQERGESLLTQDPKPVELLHPRAKRPYDKPSLTQAMEDGKLSYGFELTSLNPISAATLADNPSMSAVWVNASDAERGRLSHMVMAVQKAATTIIGRFKTATDPYLKPKLDEGLLGAVLEQAESLKQVLRFLKRLYTPPMGERSVGPSDVTGYLGFQDHFISKNNDTFIGGITIATKKGADNIDLLVKAKARGLRLIEIDATHLDKADIEKVELAANLAGIPLAGRAKTKEEAHKLYARGYRHVILGTDVEALEEAFKKFDDVPPDYTKEASPGESIRHWLRQGKIGHVGFLTTPDVNLAKAMARHANGVWLDAENGQFTLKDVQDIIHALPPGTPAIVRAAEYDDPLIPAYIAAGAQAIIVPQVSNAREARRFVDTVKRANPDTVVIVMIENRRGLSNVEEIARVAGIDVLFIGPYDLALSLQQKPGSVEFRRAIERIEAAAGAAGVRLGGLAKMRSQARNTWRRQYGFVATVYDQPAIVGRSSK